MGYENSLIMQIYEQATFHCSFDNIKDYPFEHQDCYFDIFTELIDYSNIVLIAGDLTVNRVSDVGADIGHYSIKRWSMKSLINGN